MLGEKGKERGAMIAREELRQKKKYNYLINLFLCEFCDHTRIFSR